MNSNNCGRSERSGKERTGMWSFRSVTLSANVCTARVCTAMGGFRSVRAGMLQMRVLCDRAGPRHRCMAQWHCWARLSPRLHADTESCMLKADGHQPSMEARVQATRDGHYKRRNDPAGNAVRPKPYICSVAITGEGRNGSQFVVRGGHYESL